MHTLIILPMNSIVRARAAALAACVFWLAPATKAAATELRYNFTSERQPGAILADAYHARFAGKPRYMTAYNGKTVVPGAPGYDPNLDTGAQGAMYYPLLRWEQLEDTRDVPAMVADKLKDAYELGLIRSEEGIARGRMVNGRLLAPAALVSRAKAAKALYFMWVLAQPPKAENDLA
ncbi:hypothetical protein RBA41_04045 [Massilia sp. CCM 9210]|uniref:hypothetical protein n=1 Tax=Massilia scottii TaxID=3057166 RepID=UPI002796CD2D|nr:hypothetical protein [Massilia sp. CCM 9210]MDQ1812469.1 hypothetical protein [Massilia sp. CCM 9210]